MITGLSEVQTRIAQIERHIGALAGRRPAASARDAGTSASSAAGSQAVTLGTLGSLGAATGSSAPSFADALATAQASAPAGGTAPSRSGQPTGADVIGAAKKYLGVPYVWGGTDPAVGLDCSGFVQRAFKDVGVTLARVTQDQVKEGRPVASMAQAKPGDLLFFENGLQPGVDHVGIYMGGNKMLVAPKTGDVVKVQDVYKSPAAIRRVLPDASPSAGAVSAGAPASSASPAAVAPAKAGVSKPWAMYHDLFVRAGAKHGVPAALLGAIATVENATGNPNTASPAGALGPMQLMPATAKSLGVDPRNPAQAIDGAARLMAQLLHRFNGSVDLALAGYNAGPGAVEKHGGIPPYKETEQYVPKVKNMWERLR